MTVLLMSNIGNVRRTAIDGGAVPVAVSFGSDAPPLAGATVDGGAVPVAIRLGSDAPPLAATPEMAVLLMSNIGNVICAAIDGGAVPVAIRLGSDAPPLAATPEMAVATTVSAFNEAETPHEDEAIVRLGRSLLSTPSGIFYFSD
jgi:hypothetical protein